MVKNLFSLLILTTFLLVVTGCENPNDPISSNEVSTSMSQRTLSKTTCGEPLTTTIWAGQDYNVGTMTVSNDDAFLYVSVQLSEGSAFQSVSENFKLKLYTSLPTTRPAAGPFPYKVTVDPSASSYTYSIPLSEVTALSGYTDGSTIYIALHLDVLRDSNGDNVADKGETAWGGENSGSGNAWWFYAPFVIQECSNPPTTYSLSGYAYEDCNENGTYDLGESVYSNVVMTLSNGSTTVTNVDGYYEFSGLNAGSYSVTSGNISNTVHVTSTTVSINLTNANVSNVNFGYQPLFSVSGYAYFDVNGNGTYDNGDVILPNVTVTLSGYSSGSATTDANGYYSFSGLRGCGTGKDYTVNSGSITGLVGPNPSSYSVKIIHSNYENLNFGYVLDYTWIGNQSANGFTIGYWKNNLDKAIKGTTKGVQVSKATLEGYVSALSNYALLPLNVTTMQQASNILSATGSDPVLLLSKQLMGSEFNYQNGAYIGGNQLVTYLFTYYGEYVIANASQFSSAQIIAAKDMYDAYNNSHGGQIIFQ